MQEKNASKIYNLGYKIGIMGSGSRSRVQGYGKNKPQNFESSRGGQVSKGGIASL